MVLFFQNDGHPVEPSQPEATQPAQSQNAINNKWPSETNDWNNQTSNDDWNAQNDGQNEWSQTSSNDGE